MRGKRDDVDRLLLDGASIVRPGRDLLDLAYALRTLGLIRTSVREFVECANPEDNDFPPYNRHCRGRIYIEATLDEPGHDYRCPECERPVFPFRSRKRRRSELQVTVLEAGVLSLIGARLSHPEEVVRGVFRVEHEDSFVDVCVIEACNDARYMSPFWDGDYPTLYVAIHSGSAVQTLRQPKRREILPLADLLCQDATFPSAIESLLDGRDTPPASTPCASAAGMGTGGASGTRFRSPRTIVFCGVEHDCPGLTPQQIAFLRIAMPNTETRVEALMHRETGTVWRQTYTGTQKQRDRITQLISRVNRKLCECTPPLGISFSLRTGEEFITRLDPTPAGMAYS